MSLVMPKRGGAAIALAELNAEHAPRENPAADAPSEYSLPPPAGEVPTPGARGRSPRNLVTNVTTLQDSNDSYTDTTNVSTPEVSGVREGERTNGEQSWRFSGAGAGVTGGEKTAWDNFSERGIRARKAIQIADDDEKQGDIAVVTIRVSARLARYMDQYTSRRSETDPKGARKYRKQDAVAEAFAAFYADHVMPPAPAGEEL